MASAVQMGEGYISIGLRNRIDQGARGVQASLDKIGTQTAKLGALVSATSAAILTAPVMAASRLQETMSKFDTVFGDSSGEMRKWSTIAADALGTSKREMEDMLSGMQDLLVPMGVVPDHAANMSATLSQLAVDLGSFNNVSTDKAFTDLMAAMTGSGEVMKKYGVILSETAVKQEILNMGLDPKTADNATKAQARLNIIMRGTTAAQGDAIRTADGFANQMKRLWAVVEDVSGVVGGTLVDGFASFVGLAVNAGSTVRTFVENNRDLVTVATASAVAVGLAGAGLVGFGVATKLAATGLGVFVTAATVGATVIGTAWAGVGLVMSALQYKASIGAAVVSMVWKASAGIVSSAWSALVSTLSTAFSSATWIAGAAVTTAAWVASAGAIAVAIFGLDAVLLTTAAAATAAWGGAAGTIGTIWTAVSGLLATLSVATSGAWAAGAALVSAGWAGVSFVLTALSGPAGILAGLATIATAAWTAGAGLVGTAWTALTGAFAASGLAGVTAAGLASAAWSALGVVMAALAVESSISSAVIATAWSAAAALASLAWSGFTAVLASALTPAALMTAASFVVSTAWSAAAGVASAAWSTAWAIILAPITPFLVAGAAVVAMIGVMAGGLAALAISTIDFGGAWTKAKGAISEVVAIVKLISSTIMGALSIGEYGMAAQALWAGVQLAFWSGLEGAIEAFKWFFSEAWEMTKSFFTKLLEFTASSMMTLAQAIANPTMAAALVFGQLASIADSSISFDISANADAARQELRDLLAKIEAAKTDAEKKREADLIRDESKSPEEVAAEKKATIDRLEKDGALTKQEADKARAAIDQQAKGSTHEADAFKDKLRAINLEIIALEHGEDAAERKRLADEGLTATQIKMIQALKAKKKALEEAQQAEKDAGQQRVDAVFRKADELRKDGASPDAIFKAVMKQIDTDQKAGRINDDQAKDARGRARGNLDDAMGQLRDQGRAMAEALRTPQEKLGAELKRITDLQDRGFIDEKTALRAEDKARREFADATAKNEEKANQQFEGIEQEQRRVGPSATFSGFAAAIIGGSGNNFERDQLKATRDVAKHTKIIAKEAKKDKGGKFK
ncbi:hypothetical protein [Novipirellula rosea]|uniref:Chromosome partition protein Smc n=1 Tax=Novipirellula rosea TaxID=1031540 RepID=A0ABP8NGL4_9BACT